MSAETERLMRGLRLRHDRTCGSYDFVPSELTHVVEEEKQRAQHLQPMLPMHVNARLEISRQKLRCIVTSIEPKDVCAVSTLWTTGAVIQDLSAHISDLISDRDTIAGHIFFDIGPALAHCIGDEWGKGQSVDASHIKEMLQFYGLPSDQHSGAIESMLLAEFSVVSSISRWEQSDSRKAELQLWIALLTELCERFPADDVEKKQPGSEGPAHFPVELPVRVVALAAELHVHPRDIEEHFVRGSGHGGQKVNKTSSCVELHHEPTSTDVRVQRFREQGRNRIAAYKLLIEKIEEKVKGKESKLAREIFKVRKQKAKRSRRAQEKVLKEKKMRGEIKKQRRSS